MSDAFAVGIAPFVETLDKVGRAASRDESGRSSPACSDRRRQAQDGRDRQLPAERQGDAARRRAGRRAPGDRAGQGALPRRSAAASLGDGELRLLITRTRPCSRSVSVDRDAPDRRRVPQLPAALPETFDHAIEPDRAELLAVTRRVSLLAQKNAPLRLQFSEGKPRSGRSPKMWSGRRRARRAVQRRAVRYRLQSVVPHRRPRGSDGRQPDVKLHQPAAAGLVRAPTSRSSPHHAYPSQQLIDIAVKGPLALG